MRYLHHIRTCTQCSSRAEMLYPIPSGSGNPAQAELTLLVDNCVTCPSCIAWHGTRVVLVKPGTPLGPVTKPGLGGINSEPEPKVAAKKAKKSGPSLDSILEGL